MEAIELLKAIKTGAGSRGGKFWIDTKGTVRYDKKPTGKVRKPEEHSAFKQSKKVFDLHQQQLKAKEPTKKKVSDQPDTPKITPKVQSLLEQINREMSGFRQKEVSETFGKKEKELQAKQATAKDIFTHAKELALAGNDIETIKKVVSNEFRSKLGEDFHAKNEKKIHESIGKLHAKHAPKPKKEKKPKENAQKETEGDTAFSFNSDDPNKKYEFQYKLVDLEDLITSNTDTGELNEKYDQKLQPRARKRSASIMQVDKIAQKFVADVVLTDFHQIDRGIPIIGNDKMVESGNGRLMALRRVQNQYPEKWNEYQEKLKQQLDQFGIKGTGKLKNPVLVRERVTDVDRAEFAREANESGSLGMSPIEKANKDKERFSAELISQLSVGENQSIDKALRAAANRPFVSQFLKAIPDNERATLTRKSGTLNKMGIWRIKAAIFAKIFPGIHGERLGETFFESLDSEIKNFENAFSSAMPKLAQAESLIQSGKRDKSLSLASDLTKVIDVLARLREQDIKVGDYVVQANMFGDELTAQQKKMLVKFDDVGRSQKKISELLTGYADAVLNAPPPSQGGLFGDEQLTRQDLIDNMLRKSVAVRGSGKEIGKLPKLSKKEKDWSKVPEDSILWALFHNKLDD